MNLINAVASARGHTAPDRLSTLAPDLRLPCLAEIVELSRAGRAGIQSEPPEACFERADAAQTKKAIKELERLVGPVAPEQLAADEAAMDAAWQLACERAKARRRREQ